MTSPVPASSPQPFSNFRLLDWSIRRELWEHRSLYFAPIGVAGIFLFGFIVHLYRWPSRMRTILAMDAAHQHTAIGEPYMLVAGMLMVTSMIVGAFYSIDALHTERRDRSILFWKSMPVSDLITVLSKLAIPVFVLQIIAFAITVALQLFMLLSSTAVLLLSGVSVSALWSQSHLFEMSLLLLYHLVLLHGLWHAPFYAWFLMVSAWARRAPFLWAVLPPVVLSFLEKFLFHSTHFTNLLLYHVGGSGMSSGSGDIMDMLGHFEPLEFLSSPGLWTGLAATAVFVAIAVCLRRNREA